MNRTDSKTCRRMALAMLAAVSLAAAVAPVGAALAQPSLAAEKALVDSAKAAGEVGEQADGFLGFVKGSTSDPALRAAAAAINAGRAEAFRQAAARAGVSVEAAAGAAAVKLQARTPPGQYIRNADGTWVRK